MQGVRRRRPAVEAGGVHGIWGGVAAEVPRLLDLVEEMRRRAAEVQRWSGKSESHRRREIVAVVELTCGETWSNSGEGAARTGASGLRVNPGLRADLWWGSAGAVARQGVVAVAAPACGAAEQGAVEQSGVGVAARVGGSRGVCGRYLKGGGAPLACAPGFGKPASAPGIAGGHCGRRKATLTCGPDGAASGSGRTLAGGPVRGDAG